MATASYHGANYTVIDNEPAVASFIEANEWGGNVKAVTDTFTATAGDTGGTGSFIYVGKLPVNAIPLFVTLTTPAALTWTGTIGWTGDADALGDFAAIGPATVVTGPAAATANTPNTTERDIYITTASASIVSGDSISTTVVYIQAG